MSRVILPPLVEHNMAIEAALERVESARARGDYLKWFDRELKQIDHRLSLERAGTGITSPGFIPGYWHVVRDNSEHGVPNSPFPVQGPDGEFREPDSRFLDEMRASDLQRPGALDELRRREAKKQADRDADKARAHAERVEEIADRMKSIESPGVSMAPGWTNSKRGQRGKAR